MSTLRLGTARRPVDDSDSGHLPKRPAAPPLGRAHVIHAAVLVLDVSCQTLHKTEGLPTGQAPPLACRRRPALGGLRQQGYCCAAAVKRVQGGAGGLLFPSHRSPGSHNRMRARDALQIADRPGGGVCGGGTA